MVPLYSCLSAVIGVDRSGALGGRPTAQQRYHRQEGSEAAEYQRIQRLTLYSRLESTSETAAHPAIRAVVIRAWVENKSTLSCLDCPICSTSLLRDFLLRENSVKQLVTSQRALNIRRV
jgi:hypothetical protein